MVTRMDPSTHVYVPHGIPNGRPAGGAMGGRTVPEVLSYSQPVQISAHRSRETSSLNGRQVQGSTTSSTDITTFVRSVDEQLAQFRRTTDLQRSRQQPGTAPSQPQTGAPVDEQRSLPKASNVQAQATAAADSSSARQLSASSLRDVVSDRSILDDFLGLGIFLSPGPDGYSTVSSLLPSGTAIMSGQIQVGDTVLAIDGQDVTGPGLEEVAKKCGTMVTFRTRTKGGNISVFTLARTRKNSASSAASHPSSVSSSFASSSLNGSLDSSKVVPLAPMSPSRTSRQYPARAVMQWDYTATRDDELTARAGETIVIVAEYKNAGRSIFSGSIVRISSAWTGWLWASRILQSGQVSLQRLLVPANYIAFASKNGSSQQNSGSNASANGVNNGQKAKTSRSQSSAVPQDKPRDAFQKATSIPAQPSQTVQPAPSGNIGIRLPDLSSPPELSQLPSNQDLVRRTLLSEGVSVGPQFEEKGGHSAVLNVQDSTLPANSDRLHPGNDSAVVDAADCAPPTVGEFDDPILDGMYEDESGQISVFC